MHTTRQAHATWSGDLNNGQGTVRSGSSGAFGELPVTWASRTEEHGGRTSPEELIAAAHAACFSMAFSNQLAKAGSPAERLDVTAEITFEKKEPGWRLTRSALTVTGRVPGISEDDFKALAEKAKDGCPVSNALVGNLELTVDATLEA